MNRNESIRERTVQVLRIEETRSQVREDRVAVEEPLEIRISARTLGVTMRTPGNDEELAAGLLLAEGVVRSIDEIGSIVVCRDQDAAELKNVVNVRLVEGVVVDWDRLRRSLLTNSSCGVCGKASIDALRTRAEPVPPGGMSVKAPVLCALPGALRGGQVVFSRTGGLHAAGLFSADGDLLIMREDVGRHNAVDKVIGAALIQKQPPLADRILMVSGRASYEIVQKAVVARIPVLAAVSAPSSLAVELAREMGVTLVGFLRESAFNVYTHEDRIEGAAETEHPPSGS